MTLTDNQKRVLAYIRSVGGKAPLLHIPGGAATITTLAEHGLIGVSVKLTQKARNRFVSERSRLSAGEG